MEKIAIIGQRLYDYLIDNGITQKQLSQATGIQESAISDIIRDKRNVSTKYLKQICTALHISADYLLGLSEAPPKDPIIQTVCKHFGMTGEAYKGLRVLYGGKNAYSNGLMNYFLSVFSANNARIGCEFASQLVLIDQQINDIKEFINIAETNEEEKKAFLNAAPYILDQAQLRVYQLEKLFSYSIIPAFVKTVDATKEYAFEKTETIVKEMRGKHHAEQ